MKLHLDKELFKEFIENLSSRTKIDSDIIEKDYYVSIILKDLSIKQDYLQAYFKGGTALYKILDTMNRFSEDIDLTVMVLDNQSNTKNGSRLKESALGYKVDGLELSKNECTINKGNVIGIYKYDSAFNYDNSLHKAGIIQVESTSFTVSEPYKKYNIEPLIYKLANDIEKVTLKEKYDICDFNINIITLERIFVDKIFAVEFYYIRNMYFDAAKHLYDIAIMYQKDEIKNLLKNKNLLNELISYKRKEELSRKGGIDSNLKINDFTYIRMDFNNQLLLEFNNMQNKYVLNDSYKINIEFVKKCLKQILDELDN